MPFAYGTLGAHDDVNHYGSAKRGVANGVVGLDASGSMQGYLQCKLSRHATNNDIFLYEWTSGEQALRLLRTAANDYQGFVREAAAMSRIQTASMKDVASGIVAQDASGNATVTGALVSLARNGSNLYGVAERTSGETGLLMKRWGVNSHSASVIVAGVYQTLAQLDANGDIPHMRMKVASANLRHSNDATQSTTSLTYVQKNTFTFTNGISGTLRTFFHLSNLDNVTTVYGQIWKNGVAIGTERSTTLNAGADFTEDIAFGTLAPGDTIELRLKTADAAHASYGSNFRLSYDNAADTVLVAGVANS